MLNYTAVKGFRDILQETCDRQGWTMPEPVLDYTVKILADKLAKNPWQPEPSYAERYLTLPELMERRGIKSSYFVDMGQGCYSRVLKVNPHPAITVLNQHFEFTAEMTLTAVRYCDHLREMWDL